MTNEEILKKAIEKALNNKWNKKHVSFNPNNGAYRMIFDHDFAKAFWGKSKKCLDCKLPIQLNLGCGKNRRGTYWESNLRKMVLEKDPIKYLEEFI